MKDVPESIAREARHRFAQEAMPKRIVEQAVADKRLLDLEGDPARKLAYIERVVNVDTAMATRIANNADPEHMPLSEEQKAKAESLQGTTIDFVPINFLEIGRAASRSVARVAFEDGSADGTGFMISPRLFLTNNHVIPSIEEARPLMVEFNYERSIRHSIAAVTRFALDPDQFFLFDAIEDLDFTVIAVGRKLEGPGELGDFGFLPLIDSSDKHIKGMFANVIQHPDGRPKELVVRENRVRGRTRNVLLYGADTLPGSSGSPILNNDWEVIALHHWSGPYRGRIDVDANDGIEGALEGNEGIRISSIVKQLKTELANLTNEKASLLNQALNPGFRAPSLIAKLAEGGDMEPRRGDETTSPKTSRQGFTPKIGADGAATWTIPLTVSVRLGNEIPADAQITSTPTEQATAANGALPSDGAEAFKFVPDSDYSNRKGYNPNFLGIPVALPKLSTAQKKVAAKKITASSSDNQLELKYHHFSVVMNGVRRLPFFTAVNIDGASVVTVVRKTGKITSVETPGEEGAEGYEKWYNDPRISPGEQSDQKLYNSDKLNDFQRGHLVKRTDPSWGLATGAISAQADTFHFTNCAPQHEKFNPITTRWAGVENWITDGSDDQDMRVTVFSGPVLEDDDLQLDYIKVPRQFWKVIVRVENGELLATAILADQGDLLEGDEDGDGEGAEDLPAFPTKLPAEYQCTIKKLEELTKLDFGPLVEHDTFDGSESANQQRRIHRLEDITIRRQTER